MENVGNADTRGAFLGKKLSSKRETDEVENYPPAFVWYSPLFSAGVFKIFKICLSCLSQTFVLGCLRLRSSIVDPDIFDVALLSSGSTTQTIHWIICSAQDDTLI